jgi:hypothetical protein
MGRPSKADRIGSFHTVCLVFPEVRLTIGGHSRVPKKYCAKEMEYLSATLARLSSAPTMCHSTQPAD